MMTSILALLLVVALGVYVLFGGADFGGGILELFLPPRLRSRLEATLAPVWEANHVWLIAVVVILFVGFPKFHSQVMTRLSLPISLALLAILVRGTFFSLRKYDPSPQPSTALLYTLLFRGSSFLAPVFFGFIVAGLLSVHPGAPSGVPIDRSYAEVYVAPWFHGFGLLTGLFVSSLFAYLAAVFFHGELSETSDQDLVWSRAKGIFAASFVLGGLVLLLGAVSGRVPWCQAWHPVQLACQAVATAAIWVLFRARAQGKKWLMRLAAGAQTVAILTGWFHTQGRALLKTEGGSLWLEQAAAPPVTQFWLICGLIIVLAMVVPMLVLLYRVFDGSAMDEH